MNPSRPRRSTSMPICASRKGLSHASPLPRPRLDDTDQTIHCSPSLKLSDYAEQPRRNDHDSGDINVRRGIIRVSALLALCLYRHNARSRAGPGWSRICKVCGEKGEKCQGFRGLGLKACSPAHKRGAAPLCIPRRESVWGGGSLGSAKLKAIVKLLSERLALD